MFKSSMKLILFSQKQILLGSHKYLEIASNSCSPIVTMNQQWPVLEKRKVEEDVDDDLNSKKQRVKRKMYAMFLAYCGLGYSGLQRNHGLRTIEEDLLIALKKIDVINDEEFQKQQLVNFQRAARTDKGVSALRQVINLSMREGVEPEDVNQHLPEQIRVLAIKRVTKGFNSKNSCDSRTYSYTCPTFAFAPKDIPLSEEYRMDDETYENLNKYSQMFLGTHNFYSFTSGRKPFDPACKRHILEAKWQKPTVTDGIELIIFEVRGQSFMLHQIRKMVGTLMAVCRGQVEPNYIEKALNPRETVYLPTAPGLGLLLEQVHYNWYNKKYGDNGFHAKLDFADVEQEVEEFRRKHIFPMLIKAEKEEKSMLNYLQTLDMHYEADRTIRPEEEYIIADDPRKEVEEECIVADPQKENKDQVLAFDPCQKIECTESKPLNQTSSPLSDNFTTVSSS